MITQLRQLCYRFASFLGDANAVRKGPQAIAERLIRKAVMRSTMKLLRGFK